jgi:hypothetical protein
LKQCSSEFIGSIIEFLTIVSIISMILSLADVVNNILKTKEYLSVPVTTAEIAVIKTACSV